MPSNIRAAILLPVALLASASPSGHGAPQFAEESTKSNVRYEQRCLGFTGGTCMTSACEPQRKAVCQQAKCVCADGCSSPNGTCHAETNRVVGEGFTLRNAKWASFKLYVQRVSAFDQMKVTRAPSLLNLGQDKFSLYELPGTLNGRKKFFLGSDKWTDLVAAIRATTGTTFGLWGLYSVDIQQTVVPWKPQDIALSICSLAARGMPDAIMIGSSGSTGNPIWAYVKHGSWLVYGHALNAYPGEGGYWIAEPALPNGTFTEC